MSDRGELLRGTLEMLILRCLDDQEMHGYGITERLQRLSGDILAVDEGSLYPALYRLQRKGWVTSRWGRSENNRKARFYALTDRGRAELEGAAESWRRFAEAVGKAMA